LIYPEFIITYRRGNDRKEMVRFYSTCFKGLTSIQPVIQKIKRDKTGYVYDNSLPSETSSFEAGSDLAASTVVDLDQSLLVSLNEGMHSPEKKEIKGGKGNKGKEKEEDRFCLDSVVDTESQSFFEDGEKSELYNYGKKKSGGSGSPVTLSLVPPHLTGEADNALSSRVESARPQTPTKEIEQAKAAMKKKKISVSGLRNSWKK
jgi:hypothetical protein